MNAYRIKKYIGAYTGIMNGLDTIVFTAGIGENSILLRKMICTDMDYLGITIDEDKNNVKARDIVDISSDNSKVKVLIIPTNEELEIARMQPWQGGPAIFAADGLFGFGAHIEES